MSKSQNLKPPTKACVSIPEDSDHAVSVSFPTWNDNVKYETGEDPAFNQSIKSGYPRFKIHFKIEELQDFLVKNYGRKGECAMIFGSQYAAKRSREFLQKREPGVRPRILELNPPKSPIKSEDPFQATIWAILCPEQYMPLLKQYWQHTGEGISSRHAQYFLESSMQSDDRQSEIFVEEKLGRNLTLSKASEAKLSVRTRLADELNKYANRVSIDDVNLCPTGMTAIFTAHLIVMDAFQSESKGLKAVCFGFPYTDTLKILEKWGPGAIFYPRGNASELDQLEMGLSDGSIKISSLFCEVPSNPLLVTPNLPRLRELADVFGFVVVVDDTIGNAVNVDALKYADITVSSLTKLFSGESNVMAGDLVLNPGLPHYQALRTSLGNHYVDSLWPEDAIYLERNSRDFADRSHQINITAEAVVDLLRNSDLVSKMYYPKYAESRPNYDAIKYPNGGYGGLFSIVFRDPSQAQVFFDSILVSKGPSLGTNFTLASPYTIVAHFAELDFAEKCGVDRNLIRVSVGLEDVDELLECFRHGLEKAAASKSE